MHFAEYPLHDLLGRGWMRKHGPIGARYIPALARIVPQRGERNRILRLGELIQSGLVLAIEELLKVLCPGLRVSGEYDTKLMYGMAIRCVCPVYAEAHEEPPQLRGAQAGSDDRAVQAVVKLPNARACS